MIITLDEAQKIDKTITIDDLEAFEIFIREFTHNNFQNFDVRFIGNLTFEGNSIKHNHDVIGFRVGNTIEVSRSKYNDGLYTIESIREDGTLLLANDVDFIDVTSKEAFVTLVKYPAPLKAGIKKLLEYDKKLGHKIGVKSETISRWTVSYHDQSKAESIYGYPANMFGFLTPYFKVRWS